MPVTTEYETAGATNDRLTGYPRTDHKIPDFVYAGASRCGSTWLQQALRDHPEIELAPTNPVSFFDLRYQRGFDWYDEQLPMPTTVCSWGSLRLGT